MDVTPFYLERTIRATIYHEERAIWEKQPKTEGYSREFDYTFYHGDDEYRVTGVATCTAMMGFNVYPDLEKQTR